MRYFIWGNVLLFLSLFCNSILAQSVFNPACVNMSDETYKSKDEAIRYEWDFDETVIRNKYLIKGYSEQEFTCFGIGVLPSERLNNTKISVEYSVEGKDWCYSEIEFNPEIIKRDNLYWTDLNFVDKGSPCNRIELRIVLPSGIALDSLKLHVINVDFNGMPKSVSTNIRSADCPSYPTVIPRSEWLDPYYTQPEYTPTIIASHHVVIHHGASPDTYTNGAAVVRSYWNYHVNSNGWSDIGYNYLTDKYGNIYKGRMNSDPQNQDCRGAHAGASNDESIGVNFLGNSDVTLPTDVQLNAVYQLLGWWFNKRGYDPTESADIVLQSGGTSSIPRICGHKDVYIGGTTCPGAALYAELPQMRTETKSVILECSSFYTSGTSYGDFIDGVELESISNLNTGALDGPSYNNYTAMSTDLFAGDSYVLTLTNGDYGDETYAAWIDYNHDGNFETTEKLGEIINIDADAIATISFIIPESVILGNTVMRVRAVWSNTDILASETYTFGEAEDYTVKIISPCTTPGTPINLLTSDVVDDGATFSWSGGTPDGSETVIYYWAVGLDESNPTYSANYLDRGTTTSTSVSTSAALAPYTDYEWTVKAMTNCDWTESAYATCQDFSTSCVTPGTPKTLTSSDITNTGAVLNWVSNETIGSPTITYYWAINTLETVNYETNYIQRGTTEDTNIELYSLTPGTTYYWTVKAKTSCGASSYSEYADNTTFITTSIPTPVILTWTGEISTEWNLAGNWSPIQIPTIYDEVLIPDVSASSNRYPETKWDLSINNTTGNASRKCKSLVIKNGAKVTLTGGSSKVFVDGILDIYGTFNHECGSNSDFLNINLGGVLSVYDGGVLNVGSSSFACAPSGTVNQFNDLCVNGGSLDIQLGGKVFVMDNLLLNSGTLNMEGGELWVKYYGDGSANGLGFDVYASATINIEDGNIYLCGQDNGTSAMMADWNSAATINITGGTIYAKNEQSTGITDYPGYVDFGGHQLNNFTIDRDGAITYIDDNNLKMDGDFIIAAGTINTNTYNSNIAGDFLNNGGTLISTSGTITLEGVDNIIGGSTNSEMAFNNLTIESGANYQLNPSGVTNFDVNGSFNLESGANLSIATGKYFDFYSATSEGESVVFDGDISSASAFDGNKEIDINNTVNLSGSGNITSDLRIFDNTTTLISDFELNGDFMTYNSGTSNGVFSMTENTFIVNGDFINDYRFVRGTGTLKFSGMDDQFIDCGCSNSDCNCNSEDINYRRFNNVVVECSDNKSVETTSHMRVEGDLTVNSGTFSTGDGTSGKKINIYGIATIEDGAYFNIGKSDLLSGDVADLHDNLIVRGQITTDRDIKDDFAEVRTYASRLMAEGDKDEINCDVQIYLDDATEQLGNLYISGDLIVQESNEFKCVNSKLSLTVGGDLFIYHNFVHYGTINLYGDFREGCTTGTEAEICDIASSTFNMYGDNSINFNPSSGFGNLNIISGTRSVNESGGQTPYSELNIKGNLVIEDGASFDPGTNEKDISIEGDWSTNGTGTFVPGVEKVTFCSSQSDQSIDINTSANCVFYQLDVNKASNNLVLHSDCNVNSKINLFQGGVLLNKNTLFLNGLSNSINSFMDGGLYSGYIISESSDNTSIFKRNFGVAATKYFPFATASGESLAMKITNQNLSDMGDVSIATYKTDIYNIPLPVSPVLIDHLTTSTLSTDVYSQLVDRFWQIDASGIVNSAGIMFTYVDDNWDNFNLTAQRWKESDWDEAIASSAHNVDENTVTVSDVDDFCTWVLVKQDWTLPIELLVFDAELKDNIVNINWVTSSEYNSDYFEVERSLNFENIEVVGRKQGAGFSNSELKYSLADENPYRGISYYRLKQTDYDGTSTYSDWKAIEIKNENNEDNEGGESNAFLSILSVYPNPTTGEVKVLFSEVNYEEIQYSLFDSMGRMLMSNEYSAVSGINELCMNLSDFRNGAYILVLKNYKTVCRVKIIKND